ncbi:HAMP domain-containing histidine kinase [Paenibacillus sp. J5C_2022]|uniref:HAMP domain-containing sensor histidine kinase n=1 Tax=Paenibacillus sp. J5C2022 TaxID=2977129 RepID=UPI0021CF2275|nr:HAMP domain-containing sensor histidine kinase [Paenibacillus sp. J5C2022]MCU6712269.1 HAMP domain-containing histidine kinase [Paenibacillus sp. J5C2022]
MKGMKRRSWRERWFAVKSLKNQYLLIVLGAFLFIPIVLPVAGIAYIIYDSVVNDDGEEREPKYGDSTQLKEMWYEAAAGMDGLTADEISGEMRRLYEQYPEASLFWVNGEGETVLQLPPQSDIPLKWSVDDSVAFMKRSVDSDPFTVVAFLGKEHAGPGFMTMRMPRDIIRAEVPDTGTPFYLAFVLIVFLLFITVSVLFFRQIRRRLQRLQQAMALRDKHGVPMPVELGQQDEIGALESAFNGMIGQLQESRRRQGEEEALRKSLIANLSHDLRTPLTVMNGHLYTLTQEHLSERGRQSLATMQEKASGLGELIDNLLAYTLMTSGRYKLEPQPSDVKRLMRESAAAWYPVWERAGIEADIRLEGEPLMWEVDKSAFQRILDNLFQNVVRHAPQGRYIGLYTEMRGGKLALVVADRGNGMNGGSASKGAGIGMAIVDYLLSSMRLDWERDSSSAGTRIYLFRSG